MNRRLHWGKEGIVYQHDPRHIDVLVKDLGLENGNSVQTPATPEVTEEEKPEPLSQVQQYRSQVARCLFLCQDRADITFIVNELCQRMSNPTQQSLAKLKRLARYLKRERHWGQVYEKKPVLAIDARATEHILHRQGIGKLKHIDVALFWIQDEVRSHRLRVRRIRSEDNVADLERNRSAKQ